MANKKAAKKKSVPKKKKAALVAQYKAYCNDDEMYLCTCRSRNAASAIKQEHEQQTNHSCSLVKC